MTETKTVTFTEFLRARLDEDYEIAYGGAPSPWREGQWDGTFDGPREVVGKFDEVTAVCYYGGTYGHILRFDPTRVLKDIEAKRQVVDLHAGPAKDDRRWLWPTCNVCEDGVGRYRDEIEHKDLPCPTLRILAAVYADHADYREEWKP